MKAKLRTRGVIPRLVVVTAVPVLTAIGVTASSPAAPVGAPALGVRSEACAPGATGLADGLVQSDRDLRHYEVER
jgi:hypothetical protein